MNELRQLRRHADLSQRDFAGLLDVPLNTFRMWDSGLRPRNFRVHIRTLQAAVRTGRLAAQFSVKSVFGRSVPLPCRPFRTTTRSSFGPFVVDSD